MFFVLQWNAKREMLKNVLVALFHTVTMNRGWHLKSTQKCLVFVFIIYYLFSADGNLLREDHRCEGQ